MRCAEKFWSSTNRTVESVYAMIVEVDRRRGSAMKVVLAARCVNASEL